MGIAVNVPTAGVVLAIPLLHKICPPAKPVTIPPLITASIGVPLFESVNPLAITAAIVPVLVMADPPEGVIVNT